ncbi:MAG: transporter [Pyrinomonadaceae bacterium]|nr:transporter [Pyrinomonadaceae bacterium]
MLRTKTQRDRPRSSNGKPARRVGTLQPSPLLRSLWCLACALGLFFIVSAVVQAQQPFVTDDADVTPKDRFHFEFRNEFNLLQRSSFPNLKQNTAHFELDYGLFDGVEIGVAAPLLTIFNSSGTTPKSVTGVGDMNLLVKYNFRKEEGNSRVPALTVAFNFKVPTGDVERQLGSGLADFYVNGILQKSLNGATKLRLNGGILFSGNEATGAIGIRSRGTVYTASGSLVRQFTPKLQLGVELTGAMTTEFQLGKGLLQPLVGGNYLVRDNLSFDFAILGGKFAASPRAGVQLGVSIDF